MSIKVIKIPPSNRKTNYTLPKGLINIMIKNTLRKKNTHL